MDMIKAFSQSQATLPIRYLFFTLLFTACSTSAIDTPLVIEEEFALSSFNEPSGIVFNTHTNSLFIVGDEGDLGEVSLGGTLLRQQRILNASLEGITCNPVNGSLYLVVEGDDQVLEVHAESFQILGTYEVERFWDDRQVLTQNKHGLEGITFVLDSSKPEGGSLFVVNQVRDRKNPEDVSGILEIEMPTNDNPQLSILDLTESNSLDLAGLFYNQNDKHFYVISDAEDRLIKIDQSGIAKDSFFLPGKTQEGITMDTEGFIYVAQDAGGVLKFSLN